MVRKFFEKCRAVILHDVGDEIGDALTRWLTLDPEFKILWSVIRSVSIEVMRSLSLEKSPLEDLLHNVAMLQYATTLRIGGCFAILPRFGNAIVPGSMNDHIALTVKLRLSVIDR